MRRILAIITALCAISGAGLAQDRTELTALMTAYEAQGWEGVGRLNVGRWGMCTGALVAPSLVLTAAHCIHHPTTGSVVPPSTIEFLAGWRNGSAAAYRNVRRVISHPDYDFTGLEGNVRVTNDLALLELESPIQLPNVRPFLIGERPRKGASVGVVSYARDRAENPSLQEVCHVLARSPGALYLSCEATFGASGAPVFSFVDGQPRIVSVVSAIATVQGRDVSLGTNLEKPLQELMALMRRPEGPVRIETPPEQESSKPRAFSGGGGAKFLRP